MSPLFRRRRAAPYPRPVAVLHPQPATVADPEPIAVLDPEPVAMEAPEPVAAIEPAPIPKPEPEPEPLPEPEPVVAAPAPALRGPVESMLRHPFLTLFPIVVLVGVGIALGVTRAPIYTAQSRVNVGRSDVPAYTLQGVTIGNSTLATSYARFVEAPTVITDAARAANISASRAQDHLRGTPIPQSTLIAIYATGRSSREARALSNGAATGLIDYVRELGRQEESRGDLAPYRAALREVDRLQTLATKLEQGKASKTRVVRAKLNVQAARLRAQSLSNRFLSQDASQAPQSVLQLVVPASTSKSDARTVLEQLVLVGLAAGLVLGVGLALLRSNWALIRHRRR